jgi:DNA-binding FrmR family transcriptional regulator
MRTEIFVLSARPCKHPPNRASLLIASNYLKDQECCGETVEAKVHPDHSKEIHRLNRIGGQIEGVKRMLAEREYCPKIVTQLQAIRAAIKSLEAVVLGKHMQLCVQQALESKDELAANEKLAELMQLFRNS